MDLHKSLLQVSEAMFEAAGVLQRDAPMLTGETSDHNNTTSYKQLLDKYTQLLSERMKTAHSLIDSVPTKNELFVDKMERVNSSIKLLCEQGEQELLSKLECNTTRHAKLSGLFDELVQARHVV